MTTTPSAATFDDTLHSVRDVEGWMTDAQARRLWDRAKALGPTGRIVEIGSFRGRSAIVLAKAAAPGVEVIAIDPHIGSDRGPQEFKEDVALGESDHDTFHANLAAAGVDDRIRHVRMLSSDADGEVADPIEMLYIDGAHRYGPARDDIRDWGARVEEGGSLLIHDSFSSVGVTLAILTQLLSGKRFRYVGRSGSLAEYRREKLSPGARMRNALRQLVQLPWFIRNVIIKALLLARLKPLTRLLGHKTGNWPY